MRVLLITDKSLPNQGGSQVIFHNVYRHLAPGSVRMLSRRYPGAEAFDAGAGYPIDRLPFFDIPKARMPLLWLCLAAAAPGVLRRYGCDQVHCGQSIETGWIGRWCKRRFGLPYVVHTFLEEIMMYRRGRASCRLLQRVLTEADAVTTISRFSLKQLVDLGVDPDRIHLLFPGVSAAQATEGEGASIRRRYSLEDRRVLLTVGRLAPRKGHDRVIRALPRVAREIPDVAYLIAGDGPERGRLEALVRASGVEDRVVFAGAVAHTDTPRFYRASDLFIMLNHELPNGDVEGFGLVFLEANAAGLPVIGGRSGGTADAIVDGQSGWLVDPDDEDGVAVSITGLLRDRELARRFGEFGRQRVEKEFTWERSAAVVDRIARQLSAGPEGARCRAAA